MSNSNDEPSSNKKIKIFISPNDEPSFFSEFSKSRGTMQDLGNTEHIIQNLHNTKFIFLKSNNFSIPIEPIETQLENLRESYINQKLVLVLGSGLCKAYRLPNWDTLLQKLLIKSLKSESELFEEPKTMAYLIVNIFSPNRIILARNIRLQCKNNNPEDLSFEKDVRDAIYEEINDMEISPSFKEIRQFCVAPGKSPNLDSIITFNYDDILEDCLSKLEIEIPFKPIYRAGVQLEAGKLPIYHVHGFLPRDKDLTEDNKITLSEDLYHQLYTDIYCWSNIIQINKYTNNTCLFIGTSLTDPNLRRLLDVAKEQREEKLISHYIIKERYNEQRIKDKISEIMQRKDKESIDLEKLNLDIEDTVQTLIWYMERFEEVDALSFGVGIIWVDNYDEDIPLILSNIRNS